MGKYVKLILFLLLTTALHGASGNFFTEQVEHQENAVTLPFAKQDRVGMLEYPCLPIAELNSHLQTHQMSTTRMQRVQLVEYFFSLKNVLRSCANRESSLSQHWGRIYKTTISFCCHPVSEYYVFALRRIII